MRRRLLFFAFLPFLCAGCATGPPNPSFPLTVEEAGIAMKEMSDDPCVLPRPLVVVGGFLDPIGAYLVKGRLTDIVGKDKQIIVVTLATCGTFDSCRERIIEAVDHECPSAGADRTAEVDVVGVSMGGLAARFAASSTVRGKAARRLNVARLFTISAPLQGATLAELPTFIPLQRDMRCGSPFLCSLEGSSPDYAIYPYVRLHDGMVGEENAAPKGGVAWWVPNRPFEDSHSLSSLDPRILADIGRRLRGETPYAMEPRAALP